MRKTTLFVIVISLIAVPWVGSASATEQPCLHEYGSGEIFCMETGECNGYSSGGDGRRVCVRSDGSEVCVASEGAGDWEVCHDAGRTVDKALDDAETAAQHVLDEIDQAINEILGTYDISDVTGKADRTQRNVSRTVQNATDSPVRWRVDPCAHGGEGVSATVTYDGKTASDADGASASASNDGDWDQADVWSCQEIDLSIGADVWNQGYDELRPLVFYDPCRSRSEAGARSHLMYVRGRADASLGGDGDPCADVDGGARLGGMSAAGIAGSTMDRSVGVAPPARTAWASSSTGTGHVAETAIRTMETMGTMDETATFVGTRPALSGVALAGSIGAGWVLFVLYRRLTADDVLDNEIRSSMLELVTASPAINAGRIADELGVAVATVLYHGRILDETGHLERCRDGREVVFYPSGELQPVEKALHKVAKQETKLAILDALDDRPGASMSELARLLGKHRSTVKHHVDDLVDRDLVVKEPSGRSSSLELAEPTARALSRRAEG